MTYQCDHCQDRTVVGGFLPAPCPRCRAIPGACEYCGAMDNYRQRERLRTWLDEQTDRANQAQCDVLSGKIERDRLLVELGETIAQRDEAQLALARQLPWERLGESELAAERSKVERETAYLIAAYLADHPTLGLRGTQLLDNIRAGAWRR